MAELGRGQKRFKRWREKHGRSVSDVAREMGREGEQLHKWAGGNRSQLPLHCILALCRVTGEPFRYYATPEQVALARRTHAQLESEKTAEQQTAA